MVTRHQKSEIFTFNDVSLFHWIRVKIQPSWIFTRGQLLFFLFSLVYYAWFSRNRWAVGWLSPWQHQKKLYSKLVFIHSFFGDKWSSAGFWTQNNHKCRNSLFDEEVCIQYTITKWWRVQRINSKNDLKQCCNTDPRTDLPILKSKNFNLWWSWI